MGSAILRSCSGLRRRSRQDRHHSMGGGRANGLSVEMLEGRRLLSANVTPTIDYVDPSFSIGEGESITLSGSFTDPDADTAHQVIVDWGDGSQSIFLPGAQGQYPVIGGYVNPANGHAYYLLDGTDWISAEDYARSLGGHLVSINSQAEQDWVYQTFGQSEFGGEQTLWIGLTDADDQSTEGEGHFVWTSGEPVIYTNWYAPTGEPNNAGDEDYASIWAGNNGGWNDAPVWWSARAVVEVDAPISFPDNGQSRSFQLTHRYGDDPATGTGFDISIKVVDGAGDESDEATSHADVFNVEPFVSIDSQYFGFEGREINFGGFLSDPGFLDEWTVTIDYGDGTGQTLHPAATGPLNISHAYADEGSYVMHLTASDDDSESPFEQFIQVDVSNVAPTLRGLALSSDSADEGEEVTLSGVVGDDGDDALTLTVDWGDGEQSVLHPSAGAPHAFSAAHAYADDGMYSISVEVSDGDGGSVTRTSSGELPEGSVPWDAPGGNGHWYGVVSLDDPTVFAAEAAAASAGGYLVTITSAEEQQFLNDAFLHADHDGDGYGDGLSRPFWIGLSDRGEEGTFEWGTGEALDYTNWNLATGEPNDYPWPGGEDAVAMNWHFAMGWQPTEPGQWNDLTDNGTGGMAVQWAIVEFDGAPIPLQVTVQNAAPEVTVSGPALGVPGQPRQFTAQVADPGTADTHTVSWQVLSGAAVVASGAGAGAEFTPTVVGTYTVAFAVSDDDGGVGMGAATLTVAVLNLQPDPADPSKTVLAVGGTTAGDTVVVKPRSGGEVEVTLNDLVLGTFKPTGGVHVFGQAGNDRVVVTGALTVPLTFFGGEGDDLLRSGNFSDVLIGGPGDDRVLGNARNA